MLGGECFQTAWQRGAVTMMAFFHGISMAYTPGASVDGTSCLEEPYPGSGPHEA